MIKYCDEFYKKKFVGSSIKEAYLMAAKWFATEVISKSKLNGVQAEYEKVPDEHAIIIRLYTSLPENEVMENHCKICKEVHHSFFLNVPKDCSSCNAIAFHKRIDMKIKIKRDYCKEVLSKQEETNEKVF